MKNSTEQQCGLTEINDDTNNSCIKDLYCETKKLCKLRKAANWTHLCCEVLIHAVFDVLK